MGAHEQFTDEELKIMLFLVRNRLRYESRRPARFFNGKDIQQEKVLELSDLREKIESIRLAS